MWRSPFKFYPIVRKNQWLPICHMVFNIKTEDFKRKACLVVGGHVTQMPETITYFSVVTRETVFITLTMAALHNLEIKATDVLNAYVMAPERKKMESISSSAQGWWWKVYHSQSVIQAKECRCILSSTSCTVHTWVPEPVVEDWDQATG